MPWSFGKLFPLNKRRRNHRRTCSVCLFGLTPPCSLRVGVSSVGMDSNHLARSLCSRLGRPTLLCRFHFWLDTSLILRYFTPGGGAVPPPWIGVWHSFCTSKYIHGFQRVKDSADSPALFTKRVLLICHVPSSTTNNLDNNLFFEHAIDE